MGEAENLYWENDRLRKENERLRRNADMPSSREVELRREVEQLKTIMVENEKVNQEICDEYEKEVERLKAINASLAESNHTKYRAWDNAQVKIVEGK